MRSLVLALALGACGPSITMTDSIDLTWDFAPTLDRFHDDLHTPYVKGAQFTIYVSSDDDHPNMAGWTVGTSDESILALGQQTSDPYGFSVSATATGAGTADLIVFDANKQEVATGHAEVAVPDRIELDAHGYLLIDQDDQAPVGSAHLLEGGEATYLVRYFQGSRELFGNQALSVDAPSGILANPRQTFFFEDREWLSLSSNVIGTSQITLRAGGDAITTLPIVTVPESDIDNVVVLGESESGHKDGDWLVALAQAYDVNGERIFGVDFDWDVDGAQQIGDGDLYRYEFSSGMHQMVTATRAGKSDSMEIQSNGVGFVDSSNHIGCSAGGGGGLGAGAFVVLGLVLRRRRHTRARA